MKGGPALALAGLLILIMGLKGTYKQVWNDIVGSGTPLGGTPDNGVVSENPNSSGSFANPTVPSNPANGIGQGGNPLGYGGPRWAPIGMPGSYMSNGG